MKAKLSILALIALTVAASMASSSAQAKKLNILIIWGDDVGYWNISAYNQGMMGYKTPNIDRIAKEGALFTDWYGQQSCTAGRAAFLTGQSPIRTGLTKVGLPGAKEGLTKLDPTLPENALAPRFATRPGACPTNSGLVVFNAWMWFTPSPPSCRPLSPPA